MPYPDSVSEKAKLISGADDGSSLEYLELGVLPPTWVEIVDEVCA